MAKVAVTINGRSYEVVCADGQEEHLGRLAGYVDSRVAEIVAGNGQIGDTRLLVVTALLFADELAEAYAEIERLRGAAPAGSDTDESWKQRLADSMDSLARRIEDVAARLETT